MKRPLRFHGENRIHFTCNKGTATFYSESNKIKLPQNIEIDLGHSAGKTFQLLIFNAGQVISRQDLFDHAWEGRVVTQNSLNQVIAQLREAIGDNVDKVVIRTVSRQGYVLGSMYIKEEIINNSETTPMIADNYMPSTPKFSPQSLSKASELIHPLMTMTRLPRHIYYIAITLCSLSIWLVKIDWSLLWPPDISISTQTFEKTQIIHVAPTDFSLKNQKAQTDKLAHTLSAQNFREKIIVINDSLGYYDIFCLKAKEAPRFIILSKKFSIDLFPKFAERCLK